MLDDVDGCRKLASNDCRSTTTNPTAPTFDNGNPLAEKSHWPERGCVIRPWSPRDEAGSWHVLKDGSFSNVPISFRLLLKKRQVIALLCAIGCCVFAYTGHLCAGFLIAGLLLCLIYGVIWMAALFYVYGPPLWDMKIVSESYFHNDDSRFWVAVLDGKVVGTIAIVRKEELDKSNIECQNIENKCLKVAWLRRMAVLSECRNKGVAKALVRRAVDFCRSQGYDKIELITTDVHRAAIKLYEKCGFSCRSYRPYKYFNGFITIWTYEYELELKQKCMYISK